MTDLQRKRAAYVRAQAEVTKRRAAFLAALRVQKDRGRTLDDIGAELGMSRSRLSRLVGETADPTIDRTAK